jgi:monofunctional biosynthetic peptidoglycan transglycosylase
MQSSPASATASGTIARALLAIARGLGLCLCLSIVFVVLYGVAPPPLTPLMVLRLFEGEGLSKDWVGYDSISPRLARAVIAAEDAKFCEHWGFDFEAIATAWKVLQNKKSAKRLKGGSTISNQTAKNVFLWPGDWLASRVLRKAIEPYFTLLIEFFWTKKRILEIYLNVIEWGHGVYGAEAAAQAHFGKHASDLTPREAALLAAVLPNPRRWNPAEPTAYIRRRAQTILSRMNDVPDPKGDPCPIR